MPEAMKTQEPAGSGLCTPGQPGQAADPQLARVLRLAVPVVVQLARRTMPIAGVRALSVGAIIEFEKAVEEPLDLLIHDRLIGHGQCVKIGENFGLQITEIRSRADRVRSMA